MVMTTLIDPNATALPSPNQLRRKILLKHKKLVTEDGQAMPELTPPIKEGKHSHPYRHTHTHMVKRVVAI